MTIDKLFLRAVEKKASDIHLVAGLSAMLRIDGELTKADEHILAAAELEKLVTAMLSDEQMAALRQDWELDTSYEVNGAGRFRVNVRYERGNVAIAARVISQDIPSLEAVAMPAAVIDMLTLPQGLILVTGPTGCGKSTALAAMLEHVNRTQSKNIITLEDPIEFLFSSKRSVITQRQLGTDTRSFAAALKHVVRQDPDVIMVGEMRDLDTVAATVTLAETGHLVLATLHTASAAQTIDRIIDIFPAHQQSQIRTQLALVMTAVISQRLMPAAGGGRVPAREILINTPATANLIREGKTSQLPGVMETGGEHGMVTMERALRELQQNGAIASS